MEAIVLRFLRLNYQWVAFEENDTGWGQHYQYDDDGKLNYVSGGNPDDYLVTPSVRELTAADFLRETRGKPIADKALELLAEERGVKCFANCSSHWVCGANRRMCIDLYGTKPFDGQFPNDNKNHRIPPSDLPTILTSEPGKKHREAIEEFILSLPVVSHETADVAKERTLLDVVRGVTVARICREFTEALERYGATFANFELFFANYVDDDDDAKSWIASYLDVDYGDFSSVKDYMAAIARKLGLVGVEPEVVKPKPRVRCFEQGDVYWIAIDRGSGFAGHGCGGEDETVGRRCEWPPTEFANIKEVTIEHIRQKYARQSAAMFQLDELLRETGEYVEHETERGDYVLITPNMVLHGTVKNATLQEAEAKQLEHVRGAPGSTVSLRQLGPPIKTLRSVEKTTYEIEEVQ